MTPVPLEIRWSLTALVAFAAYTDLRWRWIPNWLVAIGLCIGLAMNTYFGQLAGLQTSLLGAGAALSIYIPLFALRAMGGGDVKLMAAVGALAGGPMNWLSIFVISSLLGGVFAVILILHRQAAVPVANNLVHIFKSLFRLQAPFTNKPELDVRHQKALTMPHGLAIAAGTLAFVWLQ